MYLKYTSHYDTMHSFLLSTEKVVHAVKLGFVSALALCAVLLVVLEPLHAFGAGTDTETAIVQVTVASGMGIACDATNDGIAGSGETLNLGTITFTGDTGTYSPAKSVACRVTTNDSLGYTLGWYVATGTGTAGSRTGTGHLNSNGTNRIPAIGTGSFNNTFVFPSATNASGWGGRVSSTSSGSQTGNLDFGTDTSAEKYARVATGSSVAIRTKTSASQQNGDIIRVHFRAYIGSAHIQPTGTYAATVTFTGTAL